MTNRLIPDRSPTRRIEDLESSLYDLQVAVMQISAGWMDVEQQMRRLRKRIRKLERGEQR